jgi:hypothetical protein
MIPVGSGLRTDYMVGTAEFLEILRAAFTEQEVAKKGAKWFEGCSDEALIQMMVTCARTENRKAFESGSPASTLSPFTCAVIERLNGPVNDDTRAGFRNGEEDVQRHRLTPTKRLAEVSPPTRVWDTIPDHILGHSVSFLYPFKHDFDILEGLAKDFSWLSRDQLVHLKFTLTPDPKAWETATALVPLETLLTVDANRSTWDMEQKVRREKEEREMKWQVE